MAIRGLMLDIICEAPAPPPPKHVCPTTPPLYERRHEITLGTIARCPTCGKWYERAYDNAIYGSGWYWKRIRYRRAARRLKKLGCEVPLA